MKSLLGNALREKDVENIYRSELIKQSGSIITSPFNVDGLFENKNIRTLLEFKFDENFKQKFNQCNVLVQCLYYLKKFEDSGERLPTTIFVGDINECFALHTNMVIKYMSSEIDWKIAPSEAHKKNPELIKAMVDDVDIIPFIFDVNNDFNIGLALDKIKDLTSSIVKKVRISKHNIVAIFDYFNKNVLGEKSSLLTNERANLFIQIVINNTDNFIHPNKKNKLLTKSFGEIDINANQFMSFFGHFEGSVYSPREKESLTSLVDRLVDDATRRQKGEFFTPTSFVDLSHEYVSKTFGDDWKDRFVVWDCASGTSNLTRDYKFKNLYISTLEQSDIDTTNQMGYNMEAIKFQYDFLNDTDGKLPFLLQNAINTGKEILFLINPPYATANNMGTKVGDHKGGVSDTNVCADMKSDGWGASTQNLYAQFLYKIYKYQLVNKNIKIAIFSPPLFLTGGSYKKFRDIFFKDFEYKKGFLFEASHFSDVSKGWGISFTLFDSGISVSDVYDVDVVDYSDNFELITKGIKTMYNMDNNESCSTWVKKEIKGVKTHDAPQLTSAIKIKTSGKTMRGSLIKGAIGFFLNANNNIYENASQVSLFTSACSKGNGFSVTKENIYKVITLFTARKLISANWVNSKDEYVSPNTEHPLYKQFEYDAIVYSLFNNSSQQSSLRKVDYKGKNWDIKNEFFWMSTSQILELAEEHNYNSLYQDARTADDRFVYNKMSTIYHLLSPDAREIINIATDLVTSSFVTRQLLSDNRPELHLDSWDAGYAQLKVLWKEYHIEEFNLFRLKYKTFEDRMRPLVYELGFLIK